MNLEIVDKLLTTTRSVRRRLDLTRAVEPEIIERCLEIATQAPSGSDRQMWRFLVVTDPAKRLALAEIYRRAFAAYIGGPPAPGAPPNPVRESAIHLAEHMHEVPVLVVFCYAGRVEQSSVAAQSALHGSIAPAAWSFMLALRARGLGSAWTTLHLVYEQEAAALLGIPAEYTQTALLPVAYFTGDDFQPAKRTPIDQVTYWDHWGDVRKSHANHS